MCLIAHRDKAGSHVTNAIIEHNIISNPDGFGLMYRSNDERDGRDGLVTRNFGPDEFTFFKNELKALDVTDIEYAAHWRFGTQGPNNKAMSHPFAYEDADGEPMAVMHNGIIDIEGPKHLSDTKLFVDRILAGLQHEWWLDQTLLELVENMIGWSRLILMSPRDTIIINEHRWERTQGVNYSTKPIWQWGTAKGKVAQTRLPFWATRDDTDTKVSRLPKTSLDLDLECEVNEPDEQPDGTLWSHNGHLVQPYSEFKGMHVDHDGVVVCQECDTEGDFYVIENNLYIELAHFDVSPWEASNDARLLLPVGIQ